MAPIPEDDSGRRVSPSAERNKGPILEVLERVLPARGLVLEIASGSGQHVAHFARALPALEWQPSDADAGMRRSIERWTGEQALANVRPPIALDVQLRPWPIDRADAVVCINMIHIAPWAATPALFGGIRAIAARMAVLYGPYRRGGAHTAPSNAAFDADLRARDPAWGVRDLEAVADAAGAEGFTLDEVAPMPANNFALVFRG
jgi:hypothetical protein